MIDPTKKVCSNRDGSCRSGHKLSANVGWRSPTLQDAAHEEDPLLDNPLSVSEDSKWNKFFQVRARFLLSAFGFRVEVVR